MVGLNCAESIRAMAGTRSAIVADMHDVDAIEAINFEQLATVTDRLLLRGGRAAKRRSARGPQRQLAPLPAHRGRHQRPVPEIAPEIDATVVVRRRPARVSLVALAIVPGLFGLALGIAALL